LNSQPASQPATNSNKNQNHQQTNKQTTNQQRRQILSQPFFPWLPGRNPLTLIPAHPISSTYQPPLPSAIETTSALPPTPLLHPYLFLSFSCACFPASLLSSVLDLGLWNPRFCFQPRVC
jgi:hypothetical protein